MTLRKLFTGTLLAGVILFGSFGSTTASPNGQGAALGAGVAECGEACLVQLGYICYHAGHDHYDYCGDGWGCL